jgi:hypothetical protein
VRLIGSWHASDSLEKSTETQDTLEIRAFEDTGRLRVFRGSQAPESGVNLGLRLCGFLIFLGLFFVIGERAICRGSVPAALETNISVGPIGLRGLGTSQASEDGNGLRCCFFWFLVIKSVVLHEQVFQLDEKIVIF